MITNDRHSKHNLACGMSIMSLYSHNSSVYLNHMLSYHTKGAPHLSRWSPGNVVAHNIPLHKYTSTAECMCRQLHAILASQHTPHYMSVILYTVAVGGHIHLQALKVHGWACMHGVHNDWQTKWKVYRYICLCNKSRTRLYKCIYWQGDQEVGILYTVVMMMMIVWLVWLYTVSLVWDTVYSVTSSFTVYSLYIAMIATQAYIHWLCWVCCMDFTAQKEIETGGKEPRPCSNLGPTLSQSSPMWAMNPTCDPSSPVTLLPLVPFPSGLWSPYSKLNKFCTPDHKHSLHIHTTYKAIYKSTTWMLLYIRSILRP